MPGRHDLALLPLPLLRSLALLVLAAAFSGRASAGDILAADSASQLLQNARADHDRLSRMSNPLMLRRFVRAGYLVPIPPRTSNYTVRGMDPRYRYARPWTRLFLNRLSRQFYARFKQPLHVTSLVRTAESQVRLARYNPNAADAFGASRSSHLTGATLDISKRFMSPQEQRWMRRVLSSLRDQVYRSYPEYVARRQRRARTAAHKPPASRPHACRIPCSRSAD